MLLERFEEQVLLKKGKVLMVKKYIVLIYLKERIYIPLILKLMEIAIL